MHKKVFTMTVLIATGSIWTSLVYCKRLSCNTVTRPAMWAALSVSV